MILSVLDNSDLIELLFSGKSFFMLVTKRNTCHIGDFFYYKYF